jgi:hypothetical protein
MYRREAAVRPDHNWQTCACGRSPRGANIAQRVSAKLAYQRSAGAALGLVWDALEAICGLLGQNGGFDLNRQSTTAVP